MKREFEKTQKFRAWRPEMAEGPPSAPPPPPVAPVPKNEGGDVQAWLFCEPLEPVPLRNPTLLLLGRDTDDCDMILPHSSVSRVHAEIRCGGSVIKVKDRSTYGTFVNGIRVKSRTLKHGDVVTIGPYEISLRAKEQDPEKTDKRVTRPIQRLTASTVMQGSLAKVSLAEVFNQIEFTKKTGTLNVSSQRTNGMLVVYEGYPMYAELGKLRGEPAVFKMLGLDTGNFSFVTELKSGEFTMRGLTLTGLLLEATRILDESQEA